MDRLGLACERKDNTVQASQIMAGEKMMSAHAFLVFLGRFIFRMGMFKVFRWNGLEILIPKHM